VSGTIGGINASKILIYPGPLAIVTGDMPMFGMSPANVGEVDLVIAYRGVTSDWNELLSSLEGPFLHIQNVTVPDSVTNSSTFCVRKGNFQRCFDEKNGRIQGVIAKSTCEGNYSFPGWIDGVSHLLATADNQTIFFCRLE
jgi:hypothetical protein